MRLAFVAMVLLSSATAFAQAVEPGVVGTWVAPMAGFNMVLKIDADGRCTFDEEKGRCTAKGGSLEWRGPEVTERYRYTLGGGTLTISGGDMDAAVTFQRQGGAAPAPAAPAPEAPPPPPPTPAKGTGQAFTKEAWGVKFVAPPGWKLVEKNGMVFGGHDSEAGILIIKYEPSTTREQIIAGYQKGVNEQGVTAMPVSEAASWRGNNATGVAGELAGTTNDGYQVKIRSIAVLSNHGSALIVAGLTTADKYPVLKARVEQLASTVVMQKPKEVQGGALAGAYAFIYVSKSGSYSREAYITLCRSGRFTRRGEMVGQAQVQQGVQGNAYASHANAGTWKAQGTADGGVLVLTFDDGSSAQVPYKASPDPKDRSGYGPAVWFGNDLYQKSGAGDC